MDRFHIYLSMTFSQSQLKRSMIKADSQIQMLVCTGCDGSLGKTLLLCSAIVCLVPSLMMPVKCI